MVDIKVWKRGETIRIGNTYTDINDVVYDPSTVELEIYNPSEILDTTVTYAEGDIKRTSEGIYYYDYDISSDATAGWWISKWTGVSGSFSDVSRNQFKVGDPEEKLYCTVEKAYNICGMESTVADRDEVIDYIENAMSHIDSIYQKNFQYSNDKTELFDTDQPDQNTEINTVFLTNTPVRSITSVKEYDTTGTEVQSYDATDYWIDLKTGRLKLKSKEFTHQTGRVEVVYKYGHDTVPNKISALCSIMTGQSILLKFAGASYDDVTSYNACGMCFIGEVKLLTINGYQTFESLSGKDVKLINKDGNVSDGKVWCTGEREVIKLTLNNGTTIGCTPNHLFMVDGGYGVPAIDLLDKKLMMYDGDEDIRVVSIENAGIELVYDFYEPLINWGVIYNIVIHNSISIGEPYMNATRTFELLQKQKDKLVAEIGRLRPSVMIV